MLGQGQKLPWRGVTFQGPRQQPQQPARRGLPERPAGAVIDGNLVELGDRQVGDVLPRRAQVPRLVQPSVRARQ